MITYRFFIRPQFSSEQAWEELENFGAQPLYSEETEGSKEVVASLGDISFSDFPFTSLQTIGAFAPIHFSPIDWESQWSAHGLDYRDGCVHLDLNQLIDAQNLPVIKLKPGPGFGDLSHASTRIVLRLMKDRVHGQAILDVGSGSGVLSLAAAIMGAKIVWGIDIDPEAVEHAKENLLLNELEGDITFSIEPPTHVLQQQQNILVLMNMIASEQAVAWKSLKSVHHLPGEALISGILQEERELYLQQALRWGWTLLDEIEEEGWLGLHFLRK
ncbi:ribosomal protein L11 methyltransferase [Parachlamydia acanthamoebae UV-7]|uniref:Ribosomal protein L11 methyltransferase n=2 Tax=Parachlamydia acanthamoebae TaxID=83552 RepID=F8KWK4_PARAV|nr:50S ribosomal protein L11 methyltransferase [Parachlamydia acanthamoebae]KIA76184.1 Ribosomal protein L11 methyltransferase [Parachlamydia acanthamoebae]CCB85407.1 ribosomal protein L11 methyltransferase [Parachlamydia acanthamoebae UV-7]